MAFKRSVFPEGGYDTFRELYELPFNKYADYNEYKQLLETDNKTLAQINRMNDLFLQLKDYIPTAEDENLRNDALTGVQKFFNEKVNTYLDTKFLELTNQQTIAINSISQSKDNALVSIEQKKNNVIDYLDGTTAGQLRNDIGMMPDSLINGRSLIEKTNALKIEIDSKITTYANTVEPVGFKANDIWNENLGNGNIQIKQRTQDNTGWNNLYPRVHQENMRNNVSVYRMNKDPEGIFTEIQVKRKDGTLCSKSVLSGGTSPRYATKTIQYYKSDGITVDLPIETYSLFYDTDGDFSHEVLI